MTEPDSVEERLRAVERALTDDANVDLTDLADAAETAARVETAVDRIDDLEGRIDELEAATQALRGYVGNVRSVNRDVERRADAALAAAERLEAHLPDSSEAGGANGQSGGRDGESGERRDRGDGGRGPDRPRDHRGDATVATGTGDEWGERTPERRDNQWPGRDERGDGSTDGPADERIGTAAAGGDSNQGLFGRIRDVL